MNKRGGGEKVLNLETVKYELKVLVTKDDGDLIKIFPNLTDYDDAKRESSSLLSCLCDFHTIYVSEKDTSNKLLQFFPVEIFGNMKRLLLKWTYHAMERLPLEIFVLEDLQELRIQSTEGRNFGSHLRHLPQVIGDMKNLRILEISTFKYLEDLPSEIGNLENLEELVISHCDSLLHLPSEIGDLKRLQRLDISECSKLENLPLNKNLQEMRMVGCESLENFTQDICNLRCLRKLWIEGSFDFVEFPSGIGNLESLQDMIIRDCLLIFYLPPEIGTLRCLRKLDITNWGCLGVSHLRSIPLEVGNLLSLQEFDITYFGRLDCLALVVNKLERHLRRLNIYYLGSYDLNHADYSAGRRRTFYVEFTMTLEELNFQEWIRQDTNKIEYLINFLQSLAAENSPSSPMSLLLPQGIRCIKFEESRMDESQRKIFDKTICKLLQKYPRLGRICSNKGKILNDFSANTLHLMYLNRFVRSLQHQTSTSGDMSPPTSLAENAWPIIFEEVQTTIRNDFIDIAKNPTTIGASVIYSIIRELLLPLLVED